MAVFNYLPSLYKPMHPRKTTQNVLATTVKACVPERHSRTVLKLQDPRCFAAKQSLSSHIFNIRKSFLFGRVLFANLGQRVTPTQSQHFESIDSSFSRKVLTVGQMCAISDIVLAL